jgi:tRNA pseudouridine55 synthase
VPRSASTPDPHPPGVLVCDKPAGITSHDLVERVRRDRGGKVGHAGTLDPFATGLLLILLGRATRLQRYLLPLPKTYNAVVRLGWRSSTGDPDGELTETGNVPADLALPTGRIVQRVPLTSAVKVRGERLYKRAHRGETIETPERQVEVHRAELITRDGDRAEYEIECSSGTYVRTLIETLGDAFCMELRRIAIGPFSIDDAGEEPLTPQEALGFLPELELDERRAMRVRNGVAIPVGHDVGDLWSLSDHRAPKSGVGSPPSPVDVMRLTHRDELIAVGRIRGDEIKPEVVLAPAS